MKKILITGSNGFIGSVLLSELKTLNFKIYTISRSNISSKLNLRGNLFDCQFVSKSLNEIKPNIIIHLAWETTPGLFYNSQNNQKWSKRTIEFIDEFYSLGGSKFIFMSTCEEYGSFENKNKPNELTICKPISNYGIQKHKVSAYLSKNYHEKKWIILRNYFVSGINEKNEKLISYMVNKLINKKPIILKRPNDIIDIIDVRDVTKIIKNLIKIDYSGILNIGTSFESSPIQLAKKLVKLYGSGEIIIDKNFDYTGTNKYIVSNNSKLINNLKLKTKYTVDDILETILEKHYV